MVNPRNWVTALTVSASVLLLQPFTLIPANTHATGSAGVTIEFGLAAIAADAPAYKPPSRPRPTGPTSGTGSRGCDSKALPVPLTPLVPNGHVGQTLSARPTFFWYLADAKPVHFALVEQGVPKPIYETTVQPTQAGIMQVTIPANAAELAVGKEYRWSIALVCSEARFSSNTFAQSWIERVELAPAVKNKLASATSDAERARLYAETGLWFDAMTTLAKASAREQMLALLDQVNLKTIADYERTHTRAAKP